MSISQVLMAALVLLWTCRVFAAQPDCDANPACRQLSEEGRVAHKLRKDFPGAIERYQAAYNLVQDPRLLILLGRSFHKLGKIAQAIDLYYQARSRIESPSAQVKLQRFLRDAEVAMLASAVPPKPISALEQPKSPTLPTPRQSHISATRLGIGTGLVTLSVGALVAALVASTRDGQVGPISTCPSPGSENRCIYDLVPVFAPAYVAAGVFAVGAAVTFTWRAWARKEHPAPSVGAKEARPEAIALVREPAPATQ